MPKFIYIGGGAGADVEFLQSDSQPQSASSYSFASQNFGAEADDRYIIVGYSGNSVASISSVTIGGVAATLAAISDDGANVAGLAIALVPTGASGTIVVSFTDSGTRCGIVAYRATGLVSTAAFNTATSTANDPSVTLNIPAGGIAVGFAQSVENAATTTWSGLTKDFQGSVESAITISSGSESGMSAETARPISITWSGDGDAAAFASFGG